jgi:MoaA/NifB/PqqE/SkfB family radical SAM enzyme
MCYQKDYKTKLKSDIYLNKLKNIYCHAKEITIQGGEITFIQGAKEYINFLVSRYKDIKINTSTNGYLFDKEWVEIFLKHGGFVNFSLNAATSKTYSTLTSKGSWYQVIKNLKYLIKCNSESRSKLIVRVSFVILDENLAELSSFVRFCISLGIDFIKFRYDINLLPKNKALIMSEIGKINEIKNEFKNLKIINLNSFESKIFKTKIMTPVCLAPFNRIFINEKADVSFCCHLHKKIGNLNDEPIETLWNNLISKKIRSLFKNNDHSYCDYYCVPND